jgi:hypothetical protein
MRCIAMVVNCRNHLSTKSDVKEEADDKLDSVEEVLGEAANVKLSDLTPEQVIEAAMAIMEKSNDTQLYAPAFACGAKKEFTI